MKVSSNRICLFTVIENSETNIGAGKKWKEWDKSNPDSEPLEEEAIQCFTSWRKNAGWLKDIDIYCVCPSNPPIKDSTIEKLRDLNVTYKHILFPEITSFDCGYMNVPLVGEYFEGMGWVKTLYDYIIHIDLDMTVINPIPQTRKFFSDAVTIGMLKDPKPWDYVNNGFRNLESCFIISKTKSDFYHKWYSTYIPRVMVDRIPEKYYAEVEEYALDLMYNDFFESWEWVTIEHQYQIGERYPMDDDTVISDILFHHNHLYESTEVFEKYFKKRLTERIS